MHNLTSPTCDYKTGRNITKVKLGSVVSVIITPEQIINASVGVLSWIEFMFKCKFKDGKFHYYTHELQHRPEFRIHGILTLAEKDEVNICISFSKQGEPEDYSEFITFTPHLSRINGS
ncbi:hypothetical protein KNT64_gp024 [Pseudomonas phage PspYZU05]|uniref:Uncharacterized protein n=1 Tax=Pseudomonas phage PspYZU05 TaxID=1983556 RepID=A0A2U7N4Z0_9CAUD|nr:hypothetical protein KNT64_gp024 [Pseudomonas phage PspYZU05]ASD51976.1 hypothetical protein PspYZU05_24 [Pseudomonas phage PspYZU05]